MKYLRIIINPLNQAQRKTVLETLSSTTDLDPIVDQAGDLYLQISNEIDMVGEVFSLGISFSELNGLGIDDPFDFEFVHQRVLPPEVAMAMN